MFTPLNIVSLACAILLCLLAADAKAANRWGRMAVVARISRWGAARLPRLSFWVGCWVALGVLLRLWFLLSMSERVSIEEIWTMMDARSLLDSGKTVEGQAWPAMLARWGGEAEGPLLLWLSLPLVRLFGQTGFVVGLPMCVISCLAMVALWDFARRCFSERAGLWALILCAVSPFLLQQCRWAQSWGLFPHLLMLALWAFSRERHRAGWYICGVLLLALSMYTIDIAWYVLPLFVLLSLPLMCRMRGIRLWQGFLAVLLFVVVSLPALSTWTLSVFGGEESRVLGLGVEAVDEFSHTRDSVVLTLYDGPEADSLAYTDEKEQALLYLPWGRYSVNVSMLGLNLFESLYNLVRNTALESPPYLEYSGSYYPPKAGWLYFCSIPLTLLGILLVAVRAGRRRLLQKDAPEPRRLGMWLLLIVAASSLPLLLHTGLSMPHFTFLFYPVLLLTVCGILYVVERVRLSALLLSLLLLINTGDFVLTRPDTTFLFPGFEEAVAYAAEQPAERVVATIQLFPYPAPGWIAQGMTIWGFGLDGAYVRGEEELPGELPYEERFSYVYFPNYDWSQAEENTVYILHNAEAYVVDGEGYTLADFGEYMVMTPEGM